MDKKGFFISYNKADKAWAKWIAGCLEEQGYTTYIQAWDIRPGDDFISKMNAFLEHSSAFIPVLSLNYIESPYCEIECNTALNKQLKNTAYKFFPIRVADIALPDLIQTIVHIDIFEVDEIEAEKRLLQAVNENPIPRPRPPFPGNKTQSARPTFPGAPPVTPKNPTLAANNLPERYHRFSGREGVLKDIHTQFGATGGVICLKQTIAGLGGVGKTQIALEYAHRNAAEYADAIWWINAESVTTIFDSCLAFAEEFALVSKAEQLNAKDLGQRLQKWQNQHNSWLMIFDNVEDEETVKPYISQLHRGHILFTARKRDLPGLRMRKLLDINIFSLEEALTFMRKRLQDYPHLIDNSTDLKTFVKRLGHFPLALEQAAAYMERTQIDCVLYLKRLDEKGLTLLKNKLSKATTEYEFAVGETFALSFEALQEESRQTFRLCSYLAAEAIPLEFITRNADQLPPPLSNADIDSVVAELWDYSLITRDKDFISTHRFVQEICREQAADDSIDWLELCLEAMIDTMPTQADFGRPEPREWFNQIAAHAGMIAEYAEKKYAGDEDKEVRTALLWFRLGYGNKQLARYDQALLWYKKALAIYEKALGTEHPDTATTYNNIATVYHAKGDCAAALKWYKKALAIAEKVLGAEHPHTATIYNNIAEVYRTQGDYAAALEWHMNALAIHEKVLGAEHPTTAATFNNIALVYDDQGDYTAALKWYKKALAIAEKVLGTEHPYTAAIYNNIAAVYHAQSDYTEALDYYKRALYIVEKVYGVEHPNVATTNNNIAVVYRAQGDYLAALKWYNKALRIREKVLGTEHPATATTYNNIAVVYKAQGDYATALQWYKKACRVLRKVLGDQHPHTQTGVRNAQAAFAAAGLGGDFEEWLAGDGNDGV